MASNRNNRQTEEAKVRNKMARQKAPSQRNALQFCRHLFKPKLGFKISKSKKGRAEDHRQFKERSGSAAFVNQIRCWDSLGREEKNK